MKRRALPTFLILFFLAFISFACTPLTIKSIPTSDVTPTSTISPTSTMIPTPTIRPLPAGVGVLTIDGVKTSPVMDDSLHTWVWRNKKGEIRRLLDTLTGHILARSAVVIDHLTYDIDLSFNWEANLVNIIHADPHSPYGAGYIQLLQLKYPQVFPDANSTTGILFRLLQGTAEEISDKSTILFTSDEGTKKESVYLKPSYDPNSNEYTLTLLLATDYYSQRKAVQYYTRLMLNYGVIGTMPPNPTGPWGVEIYEHLLPTPK